MLKFSDTVRTSRAQVLATAIDTGSAGPATLKIYTGGRPAPGAAITSQQLLVTLQFQNPCAQSVTVGVLTLKPLAEQMATGNGAPLGAYFQPGRRLCGGSRCGPAGQRGRSGDPHRRAVCRRPGAHQYRHHHRTITGATYGQKGRLP